VTSLFGIKGVFFAFFKKTTRQIYAKIFYDLGQNMKYWLKK